MSKLIDRESLEKLAKALDSRAKASVAEESARAEAAENALQAAIDGKANASHGNHVPTKETADNARFLRNDNTWATITPANIGAATSSHGTHVDYATVTPKANGTAAIGTSGKVAREDHVHPLQSSVSGNAGSADKLATARTITIGNQTNSFDGSENITYSFLSMGVSAIGHTHDDRYYIKGEINTKITNLQAEIDADVKVEADRAKAAENALQANIDKKAASGHTHDDRYYTESEINTKVADLQTEIDNQIETVNNSITDAVVTLTSDIGLAKSSAISESKSYTDTSVANLVDSAPSALNTLNELATAINEHQDVYDAYVTEVDAKLAQKENKGHTHNYAGSASAGGAANSANKVNQNLVVKLNGGSTEGTNLFTFNGSTAKTINITPSGIGAAASSHGTHVSYGTATPKANGTAAVGTSGDVARADHVHPLQATVSGNAGSANKWSTARTLTIGNTGKSVDGSENVTWSLSEIGAMSLTLKTDIVDLNSLKTTGVYNLKSASNTNAPRDGNANLFVNFDVGTPYQLFMHDATFALYYRRYDTTTATWNAWESTLGNSISGNAATVTKLATARNINGTSFDGSGNITTANWGTARNIYVADSDGTNTGAAVSVNGSGNATLKLPATIKASLTGNASTATKLAASKTINGTAFDGSGNITTSNWGTARTLTIGNKGQSVNGSENVSWSLTDIGASPLQKSAVSRTVSGDTLTLTNDRYQTATLTSGNTIVLPYVTAFTEINLFVKDCDISTINIPDACKWRVDPNLEAGTSFMFTFFYTGQEWLAEVKIYS